MTRSEDTDTATRRGFLRSATAGAAAVSAGVAGASASAAAQSENETGNGPTGNETAGGEPGTGENETGGHSEEGGRFVLTDSILMMLGFIVVGVLSPVAFAVFLARNYRGDSPE
jgi:hypothetical protein